MSKSTITEIGDQSSSQLDELAVAISGQRWETVEAGESSSSSSLIVIDTSEKTHSQHSGFSQVQNCKTTLEFAGPVIVLVCAPDNIPEKRYFKTPELQRHHLQNAPVHVPSANRRINMQQREKSRQEWRQRQRQKCSQLGGNTPQKRLASPWYPEGAPMSRSSKRVCLQSTEASDNEWRYYNHPAPQKSPSQLNRRNWDRFPRFQPDRKRALDTAGLRQVPPQKPWLERRRYNHQDPQKSPSSQSNQRNRDRLQPWFQPDRKRALNNAGLRQVPPQKPWLERRRYNHQDPQKSPSSQLSRRDRDTLQPWSQPDRKRALDNSAGVEMPQPQKKLPMATKFNSQRSGPGIFDQIEHLCCIFARSCVI